MTLPPLAYGAVFSSILPASIGLATYLRLGRDTKMLAFLSAVACAQSLTSFWLGRMGISNYLLLNTYRPVELLLIAAFLYRATEIADVRRFIALAAIGYVVVWILDTLFLAMPDQLNSRMALLSRVVAIALCVLVMYTAWKSGSEQFVDTPLFWVGSGVILYSCGTLMVLGLSNTILKSTAWVVLSGWYINWSLLILTNLLFSKGLLCKSPT